MKSVADAGQVRIVQVKQGGRACWNDDENWNSVEEQAASFVLYRKQSPRQGIRVTSTWVLVALDDKAWAISMCNGYREGRVGREAESEVSNGCKLMLRWVRNASYMGLTPLKLGSKAADQVQLLHRMDGQSSMVIHQTMEAVENQRLNCGHIRYPILIAGRHFRHVKGISPSQKSITDDFRDIRGFFPG